MMDMSQRTIVSHRNEIAFTGKTHQAEGIEACPFCGGGTNASRPSFKEMALDGICATVLFAILVPICYVSQQWLDQAGHHALDRLIWCERLESWNR